MYVTKKLTLWGHYGLFCPHHGNKKMDLCELDKAPKEMKVTVRCSGSKSQRTLSSHFNLTGQTYLPPCVCVLVCVRVQTGLYVENCFLSITKALADI